MNRFAESIHHFKSTQQILPPFQNKSEMSNQFNTVLIAGATGFLGFKIANAFLDKKQFTVRILARKSSDKTDQLKSKGAEVLEVDFNDPEALKKATSGVDAVVSVLAGDGFGSQPALITAAAASGVKRFIPSEFGISSTFAPAGISPIADMKWGMREQIQKSGMEYTFITTHVFMEYLFSPFGGVDFTNAAIDTYGPDVTFGAIHTDDIARLVPEVLLNPNSKNIEVHLGTETFKWDDVVQKIEKLTGKIWKQNQLTEEKLTEIITTSKDILTVFGATIQRQALRLKSTALHPFDNITDQFYESTKKNLIKLDDYLAQITKKH